MRRRRIVYSVAIAVTVLAAVALAGCSVLAPLAVTPSPTPQSLSAPDPASNPSAGQCWNASYADAVGWSTWRGSEATSCSNAHELYTYAVPTLTGSLPDSEFATPDSPTIAATIVDRTSRACGTLATVLPALTWNQRLVRPFFFLPAESDWRSGARWARCDFGLIATGTTVADERFAALPPLAMLRSSLASDPVSFEFCLDTRTSGPPFEDTSARITGCSSNPRWRLSNQHGSLPGNATADYPNAPRMQELVAAICSQGLPAGYTYNADYPLPADWAIGDRSVSCWIAAKIAPRSSGAALQLWSLGESNS